MGPRVALLGLVHEANTFAPEVVDVEALDRASSRGPGIVTEHGGAATSAAGFLRLAGRAEIVPLVQAYPNPSGVIAQDAMDGFVAEMVERLRAEGPFDAVFMALHGAGVASGDADIESTMIEAVRRVVGPEVLIAATFDMHANLSARTGDLLDVATGYQTNPHVDSAERAERAGQLLLDGLAQGRRPVTVVLPIPCCVTILRQATATEPMASLLATAREIAASEAVLDVSLMEGFPYADVPTMGMSVIVVADDRSAAERAARRIAEAVWARRAELEDHAPGIAEAVELAALGSDEGPVLLLDVGDNIGGGSPGDSVELLRALVERGVGGVFCLVNDPRAAEACWRAGVGAQVELAVGGASPASPSEPLVISGEVTALRDGPWCDRGTTHMGEQFFDTGRSAMLRHGDESYLLVTSRLQIPSGLGQARSMGVDPETCRVVVGKGVNSPLAGYGPIAGVVVQVDTPGVTRASFEGLGHQHRPHPLFPFEREFTPDFG